MTAPPESHPAYMVSSLAIIAWVVTGSVLHLRVYRGLSSFDGSSRIGAWIHTIATNVAITEYRKRKAQKRARRTLSLDAPIAGADDLYLDPEGKDRDPADLSHQREFVVVDLVFGFGPGVEFPPDQNHHRRTGSPEAPSRCCREGR